MDLRRHRFRAMGTDIEVLAQGTEEVSAFVHAAASVEATFEIWERRCSRFRDDSEIAHVNRAAGGPCTVSRGLAELLGFALDAAKRTDGRFDPTVLGAVVAAGYDRDFDDVLAGARIALHPARPCGRWREIALDADRLVLPLGVGLDLGGVAKGWTVDVAADVAIRAGLGWVVVNAGGDLRLAGSAPPDGLEVGVEDPEDGDAELLRLRVLDGALATSSITRRAWGPGLHHLIDPASGRPASNGVLQATVWAPTAAEAEIAAKDVLLRGEPALEDTLAVVVTDDGRVLTNLTDHVEEAA